MVHSLRGSRHLSGMSLHRSTLSSASPSAVSMSAWATCPVMISDVAISIKCPLPAEKDSSCDRAQHVQHAQHAQHVEFQKAKLHVQKWPDIKTGASSHRLTKSIIGTAPFLQHSIEILLLFGLLLASNRQFFCILLGCVRRWGKIQWVWIMFAIEIACCRILLYPRISRIHHVRRNSHTHHQDHVLFAVLE